MTITMCIFCSTAPIKINIEPIQLKFVGDFQVLNLMKCVDEVRSRIHDTKYRQWMKTKLSKIIKKKKQNSSN